MNENKNHLSKNQRKPSFEDWRKTEEKFLLTLKDTKISELMWEYYKNIRDIKYLIQILNYGRLQNIHIAINIEHSNPLTFMNKKFPRIYFDLFENMQVTCYENVKDTGYDVDIYNMGNESQIIEIAIKVFQEQEDKFIKEYYKLKELRNEEKDLI